MFSIIEAQKDRPAVRPARPSLINSADKSGTLNHKSAQLTGQSPNHPTMPIFFSTSKTRGV